MKRDKRGRVRFGFNGYRYELTRRGLQVYRRWYQDVYPIYLLKSQRVEVENSATESAYVDALRCLLSTEEGRAKLADALTAVDQTPFTAAVHIPPNMRAVQ